jgi:hypothetical protein
MEILHGTCLGLQAHGLAILLQLTVIRLLKNGAFAGCFPGMWFHCTKFLRDAELTLAYAVILSSAVISQVS